MERFLLHHKCLAKSLPLKTLTTSVLKLKLFTKSKFPYFEESRFIFVSQLYVPLLELKRQAEKEILVGEKSSLQKFHVIRKERTYRILFNFT